MPDDVLRLIVADLFEKDPEDLKKLKEVSTRMRDIVNEMLQNPEWQRRMNAHNHFARSFVYIETDLPLQWIRYYRTGVRDAEANQGDAGCRRITTLERFDYELFGECLRKQAEQGNHYFMEIPLERSILRPDYQAHKEDLTRKLQLGGLHKVRVAVEMGIISMDDLMFIPVGSLREISLALKFYLRSLPNPKQPAEDKLDFYRRQFEFVLKSPRDMANLQEFIRSWHVGPGYSDEVPLGGRIDKYLQERFPDLFFRTTGHGG